MNREILTKSSFELLLASGMLMQNLGELKPILEVATLEILSNSLLASDRSQNLSKGIFTTDVRGNFLEVNQSLCTLLNFSVEELLKIKCQDVIYPDDVCLYIALTQAIIVGEIVEGEIDLRYVNKFGELINAKTRFEVFHNLESENRLSKIVGKVETIVPYTSAEISNDSEQSYLVLFLNNPQPMWIYDLGTLEFLAVNHAAVQHYGYTQEEFLSMTIDEIRPSEDIPKMLRSIAKVTEGLTAAGIWRHYKKDGTEIYVDITAHTLTFNGRPAELVLAHDVTEQKHTEAALRQAEAKYRSIFENAVEGIFQTSANGHYLTANPMLAKIYGYSSPDELMDSVTDIASQLYVKPERRLEFMRLLESQNAVNRFESQIYRKDGSVIWISENARTIRDSESNLIGYEGTVEDITEYKRAEEELKLLQNLTLAISEAETFYAAIGIALKQICEATSWIFGEAWIASSQNPQQIECCPTWFTSDGTLIEFRRSSENIKLFLGDGIAGRVWLAKQPEWLQDVSLSSNSSTFLRRKTAIRFGLRAALGIPILAADEVVAVMVFFMKDSHAEDKRLVNLVSTVATHLGSMMQRKRAEAALRQSEERFRLTIDNALTGMNIASTEGNFLQVNHRMCEITGYSAEELVKLKLHHIIHPDDLRVQLELITKLMTGEMSRFQIEQRLIRKDGCAIDTMVNVALARDSQAIPVLISQFEDITDRKSAEARIKHLAFHDSLTNLPNRALFKDRLNQALVNIKHRRRQKLETTKKEVSTANSPLLAVMFLDLDRFKLINDTLGHAIGDRLLQVVAQRLQTCIGDKDTLARLGGDEFMILLPEIDRLEDAIRVTHKILECFESPFNIDDQELHVTTSVGVSFYPTDGNDAETLLKNADTAMFRAKDQGRNHYRLYARTMNAKAFENMALENRIRKAISQEEFKVYYQPQVDLYSGQIIGMEALVRWQHPDLGLITPAQFIPIAEEYGLIIALGEWILRTACLQNQAWQEAGLNPIRVAVNFSARQFQEPNLAAKVSQILHETKLNPEYLELEITESVVMKDESTIIATMKQLKETGIQISIDDFGTGYSSLSHLKRFPVEKIKIDASFIRDITNDSDDAAITAAIIAMAHGLKLKAIAEGVERIEQLEFLRSLQCDGMQGYLFSPPLPAEEVTKLLLEEKRNFK